MTVRLPWRALAPALTPVALSQLRESFGLAGTRAVSRLPTVLQDQLGVADVLLCDSGTSALRIALETFGGTGPIALPAFGCFDLATAAIGARRAVHFYDVEPATLAPDLASVTAVLHAGVTALVVAGTYGYPPDMPELRALCTAHGAALIEDIAQGAGARWDGRPLGQWGDAVVLSFGRGKAMGGAGGGACAFRTAIARPELLPTGWSAGARGVTALLLQQWLGHPALFAVPQAMPWLRLGETRYHAPWRPSAMATLPSALALQGYEGAKTARDARARIATAIEAALGYVTHHDTGCIRPLPSAHPGYLRLGAFLPGRDGASPTDRLPPALNRLGVRRVYPCVLPDLPPLREASSHAPVGMPCPGAREIVRRLVTVPTHRHVTAADIARLASAWRTGR